MKSHSVHAGRPVMAAAWLAFASTSQAAVLLADFSAGTNPVQGWGLASLATATPPADGSGSWAVATVAQYWGQFAIPSWATGGGLSVAAINSHSQLEFDLILPATGWASGNMTLALEIEAENLPVTTVYSVNHAVGGLKDQSLHFAIDYSASLAAVPDSSWIDLRLYIRPGYDYLWDPANPSGTAYTPQTVYLDNLALAVPEPSAWLACVSGLGLVLRRRRA